MTNFSRICIDGDLSWKSCVYLAAIFWVAFKFICWKKARSRDTRWIRSWEKQRRRRKRYLQREVYLREELDQLKGLCDGESSSRRHAMQHLLDSTVAQLWLCKQDCAEIYCETTGAGPLLLDFWAEQCKPKIYLSKGGRGETCRLRGGCCERKCGCCHKPRRTEDGKTTRCFGKFTRSYDNYSHCTEECGCCRRYWGFKAVERNDDGSLTYYA